MIVQTEVGGKEDTRSSTKALVISALALALSTPLIVVVTSTPPSAVLKWSFATGGDVFENSGAIGDVDGDGMLELIIGTTSSNVYCINGTGALKWTFNALHISRPAIADVDLDGKPEIILASASGDVYCLNGTGGVKWVHQEGQTSYVTSPTVADVDLDGRPEIIVEAGVGNFLCLNGTGTVEWSYPANIGGGIEAVDAPAAVADLNGDGKPEIVMGVGNTFIYCLNGTGHLRWMFSTGGVIRSGVAIADIDGDGFSEILFGSADSIFYCLDRGGQSKWMLAAWGWISSSPTIADLYGDGAREVIGASDPGDLFCLDGMGGLKWYSSMGVPPGGVQYSGSVPIIRSSPTVADADGDGQVEIVVGSLDSRIYCFSGTGSIEWEYTTGGYISSSPLVSDFDLDGEREVIVASWDGKVYSLSAPIGISPTYAYPLLPYYAIAWTVFVLISVAVAVDRRRGISTGVEEKPKWETGTEGERGKVTTPGEEPTVKADEGKGVAIPVKCIVCNLQLGKTDAILMCPHCGGLAHRAHILEWLHVKRLCPYCHKPLTENDLIKQPRNREK